MSTIPTRLVICVDDTRPSSSTAPNQTNVHRIYASLQEGACTDSISGASFNQIVKYIPGISSVQDSLAKGKIVGVFGQSYIKQIQDVYESCSQLSPEDELWLFGFGRGAYIVRSVAGLLHTVGALASAGQPEFERDFKKVLKDAEAREAFKSSLALTLTTSVTSTIMRPAPRIQFVGVFETIRASGEETLDISFNSSIRYMRQALALHEDRKSCNAEAVSLDADTVLKEYGRSFVQGYFVGQHGDIGGVEKTCGLALYPCQWMLLEARQCGLAVDIVSPSLAAQHPLSMVFPASKGNSSTKTAGDGSEKLWSFTTENQIVVTMQDLRHVHGLTRDHEKSYAVKLTSSTLGSLRQKKRRQPFTAAGHLRGYCDWAPQGTIIHPSVYLLLDEHISVSLETKELKLQRHIEDWRAKMLGSLNDAKGNVGLWLDDDDDDTYTNSGAIRVLVCGNTGVGKSTLINKTFGVDVTQSSHRFRGIHDVREEITWQGRPDLIVHDSGGFEAGGNDELQAIEGFLQERSLSEDVLEQVHVIWFCIDINSPRTLQTATEKLFSTVSKYAKDVPIVVVTTKKDDLLDIEFSAWRKILKKEGRTYSEEDCERYAEERLRERVETIRGEMERLPDGRLDACLAVSQDDPESISRLSKLTSQCFDSDRIRLLYIRAQISRIAELVRHIKSEFDEPTSTPSQSALTTVFVLDLKIDLAEAAIIKRYRKLVRSSGAHWAPLGATLTRKVSTAQVTQSVIDCFGLPSVSAKVAIEALKANVWNITGSNIELALSEILHLIGLSCTGLTFGSPFWLLTGSINTTYVVPTTCRLFLIMACDLTLVLARSFKEKGASGQPSEKDVCAAARQYRFRGYSQHVQRDVKKLIPRKNLRASFRVDNVQRGVGDIFSQYKDKLMDDVDLPLEVQGVRIEARVEDDTSTEADSLLFADVATASNALAELEAGGTHVIHELDGATPIVELPAEMTAAKPSGEKLVLHRAELEGSQRFHGTS